MGQYRLSLYLRMQIGLMLNIASDEIIIGLPFVEIHIATTKEANGIYLFGKDI